MTHDFHYYVTYMCARNAGYSIKSSLKIALCADGVDGGSLRFAHKSNGKYKSVTNNGNTYFPLTVYETTNTVNSSHSLGASIASVPWMAFHFLPSLEITKGRNEFYLTRSVKGTSDKKALDLESGLICCKNSRFAAELLKHTANIAKSAGSGNEQNKQIDDKTAAELGIRAHIIADLFAHSGFAGCRSVNINALAHANNKKKLSYHLQSRKSVSGVKVLGIGRLGHGQAGQRPDEPFLKYSFQRKKDNAVFTKDNYDLFGQAVATVTEILKGRDIKIINTQKKAYDDSWITKWEETERRYRFQWQDFRKYMDKDRKGRINHLRNVIKALESKSQDFDLLKKDMAEDHDRTDYWPFDIMASNPGYSSLAEQFSVGADNHLKWFHETFKKLSGAGIDEYLNISILWGDKSSDATAARRYTKSLKAGEKVKIGKTSGYLLGNQIGTQYMKSGLDFVHEKLTLHAKH